MYLLLFLPSALAAPRLPLVENTIDISPGYKIASTQLTAALNLSVDPCIDFFDFSCGNWIANNPIPAHLTAYGSFHKLREQIQDQMKDLYESKEISSSNAINKVRQIYHACMNEEEINRIGTREMLNEIQSMGFWPIVHGSKWKADRFNLTDLLTKVFKSRGTDIFFDASPGIDHKNVKRRVFQFNQGNLGMGTRDYYLDKKKFTKQIDAYRNFLIQKATQITLDAGLSVNKVKIASEVEEVINFESRLAQITVPEDQRRNFSQMYHIRHFNDLNEMMPIFDWKKYFFSITPTSIHIYLKANPEVIFSEPDFFNRLTSLLNSTSAEIITNYVFFRFVNKFGNQLGTKYDDINQVFLNKMYGKMQKSPRWKDCVTEANANVVYASGSMYVRKHFDSNSKDTTLAMISDLQAAFKEMLEHIDWMDEETKAIALEKADRMQKMIGYPDFILDDEKLDEFYKNLDFGAKDSYNKMISKSIKFETEFNFNRLLKPVDKSDFAKNPADVNAFYNALHNSIKFPAAILQVPFFNKSFPRALNYGGIGAIIGHEITHGFDDRGRQFDAFGNMRGWWNDKTTERYLERTKCIIEQYGNVTVPSTGLNINGKLTQGENVADNGGVKEAFKAYKRYLAKTGPETKIPGFEKFTNEQMFFIGYAQSYCGHMTPETQIRLLLGDPHSPGRYRVNIVLKNQPEFATAFNCPSDSPMNPQKRCSVW